MKYNKKQLLLIIAMAVLVIAIMLLLSMCGGGQDVPEPSEPAQIQQDVEESSKPTEKTTDPTGETEETDPTEETEETTGGNTSRPGSSGGYTPDFGTDDDDDSTSTQETTPKAGSDDSPYMEVVSAFPDSVNSVSVTSKAAVSYQLALQDATVETYKESLLVIEDPDAYVVYKETKYEAKNGIVSVPLTAEEEGAPVSIQIGSKAVEAKHFALKLDAPMGTKENPQEILWQEDGVYSLKPVLSADDKDGYHFGFTAKRDGLLMLNIDSIKDAVDCDIIVTAGGQTVTIPGNSEESSVELEFKKNAEILVQVIAKADAEEKIPALEAEISGIVKYYGSKISPIKVTEDFTTEQIAPGDVVYYLIENMGGRTVNVEAPAYIIYNDTTCKVPGEEPDDSETSEDTGETEEPVVVSVKFGNTDNAAVFAIGTDGEEAKGISVTFGYPAGNINNKAPLLIANVEEETEGINTAVIGDGDVDVYWYSWKNEVDEGVLTLQFPREGSWKYAITHTSGENKTEYGLQASDMPDAVRTVNLVLKYGDVVDIFVTTYDPDAEEGAAAPAGSVQLQAAFLAHETINATGNTFVTVDSNGLQYCKQGLKYAENAIMTAVAVEVDEEGNPVLDAEGNMIPLPDRTYTIDYEGTVYDSTAGKIIVENINMESSNADVFSILNTSEEKTTYAISFSYPPGNQENPIPLELGKHTVELYGDGGSGTYYTWTATEPCTFGFEIDPNSVWSYNITSTKDTSVSSSTQNGASTDYVSYVELIVGQSHIANSKDGTVTITINLGNPSTDAANKSVVNFEIGCYKKRVTDSTTVTAAAGQTYPLQQKLTDTSASGMVITGADSFRVLYAGQEFVSNNGAVTVANFTATNKYFQIINDSTAEQTYDIKIVYPMRSAKNPEVLETGTQAEVALKDIAVDQYQYFTWTAPADGEFKFELVGNINALRWRPWKYEVIHGKNVHTGQGSQVQAVISQAFAVKQGDIVSVKFGVLRADKTTVIPILVTFTQTEAAVAAAIAPEAVETEYTGSHVPQAFQLKLAEGQQLAYADLTQAYALYLAPETGIYYLTEEGRDIYVDFSSDAFANLKKLLETEKLFLETTAEDGTVTRETYNALLQKYIDCAQVIPVSETEEKTLYPLTEDLAYILNNLGSQLGWYDSTNSAYLFAQVTDAQTDSLWMFACCYVQAETVSSTEDTSSAPAHSAAETATEPEAVQTPDGQTTATEPEQTPPEEPAEEETGKEIPETIPAPKKEEPSETNTEISPNP